MSLVKKCISGKTSKFCVILGSQWGDEGKGKLVDILADRYDYTCRFNGGNNAGNSQFTLPSPSTSFCATSFMWSF